MNQYLSISLANNVNPCNCVKVIREVYAWRNYYQKEMDTLMRNEMFSLQKKQFAKPSDTSVIDFHKF